MSNRPPPLPLSTPQLSYRRSLFRVVTGVAPKALDVLLILASGVTVLLGLGGFTLAIFGYFSKWPRDEGIVVSLIVGVIGSALTALLFYWSNHFRHKAEYDRTAEELAATAAPFAPPIALRAEIVEIPEAALAEESNPPVPRKS